MKVSELKAGAELDVWVARAMGYSDPRLVPADPPVTPDADQVRPERERKWSPSTDIAAMRAYVASVFGDEVPDL